ncbi:Uncharacterised protein g5874 [Pycnogonum litorale]
MKTVHSGTTTSLLILLAFGQSSALIFSGQTLNAQLRFFFPARTPVLRFFHQQQRSNMDIGKEIGKSILDVAGLAGMFTAANSLLHWTYEEGSDAIINSNHIFDYLSKMDVNNLSEYLGFGSECKERLLCELQEELDDSNDIVSSTVLLGILSNFPAQSCGLKKQRSCYDQFSSKCKLTSKSVLKYILSDLTKELL